MVSNRTLGNESPNSPRFQSLFPSSSEKACASFTFDSIPMPVKRFILASRQSWKCSNEGRGGVYFRLTIVSHVSLKITAKLIKSVWRVNSTWILFLTNFYNQFSQPKIKFLVVSDIENIRIDLEKCNSTFTFDCDHSVSLHCPFRPGTNCPRCTYSCIWRYSRFLPLLKFFIVDDQNLPYCFWEIRWVRPSMLDAFLSHYLL